MAIANRIHQHHNGKCNCSQPLHSFRTGGRIAGAKLPAQKKSMTGGLNKLGRDSMGDSVSGLLDAQNQIVSPNLYNDPVDQNLFYRNISEREHNGSGL